MPIHLQNHRTSNAKLFSITGNKQKLHTAASFQQTHKSNLKVIKNNSGNGLAMMGRLFQNPTNAKPEVQTPTEATATAAPNNRRRRHSLGNNNSSSSHTDPGSSNASASISSSSSNHSNHSMRSQSPNRSLVGTTLPRIKPTKMTLLGRSQSFGTPAVAAGQDPRKALRRRGSGDSAHSAQSELGYHTNDDGSSHTSLRTKRDQLRCKSMGYMPDDGKTKQQQPKPLMSLLDNDGDNDDDSFSSDDLLG